MTITSDQIRDMVSLRDRFPFRHIWCAIMPDGSYEMWATATRHKMNRYARIGAEVFELRAGDDARYPGDTHE